MYHICCIGHITLDKVVTPEKEMFMAGGTSFYFSNAIRNMKANYVLVTSLAEEEMHFVVAMLMNGIEVRAHQSAHTVYFENIYSGNLDHRNQRVLQTADPFTIEQLEVIDAGIFHLGPLLAGDISIELIKSLAQRAKLSLDVQGYLRKVENSHVVAVDWEDKIQALPYISILKANESEAEVLTGEKDLRAAAKILNDWGVEEVVITLGSLGSLIYRDGIYYTIPVYKASSITDATGCGDTYMAGYLCQRIKGAGIQQAGEFAAAMASIKIASAGPFSGTEQDVLSLLAKGK